jgi:GT2 family glycosyltransferase
VTYNQKQYLEFCINSILKQHYPCEIIVVDNCSTDGSAQFVKKKYPSIKLVESSKNKGYGYGNNLGVKYAKGNYIVIINPDTVAETSWLHELVKPLEDSSRVITTPKILLYDGSAIDTCGTINHFSGLTFVRGLGKPPKAYSKQEYVSGFSGCCFAIRREDFEELGGFDESFFLYNEDSDLSWRAHLRGFKILYVPTSIIRHDHKLSVPPEKIYHLEKGRYLILRKYLSIEDILLLFPSLLIVEILTWSYATKSGLNGLKYKLKAIRDGMTIRVEKMKGDKIKLFKSLCATIPLEQLISNKMEKIIGTFANKIFESNYEFVRRKYLNACNIC